MVLLNKGKAVKGREVMRLFWICLLAVIIVAILYMVIHRLLINRATIMVRRRAQEETDKAVNAAIGDILDWQKVLSSEIVADVWGKGVLAFEYHFDYQKQQVNLDEFTADKLAKGLNAYAKRNDLQTAKNAAQPFVITDWWTYEGILHIDVAYLINEATVEYIDDLKRLNHHNNK